MISSLVTLSARLETAEKALSEEKATRLPAEQSCAEEKNARQAADQSLQASKEAKAALA
jgi:chromosome segregation ATPase